MKTLSMPAPESAGTSIALRFCESGEVLSFEFWVLSSELEDGASALVYLVCFVHVVHLVSFVQPKNQTNKTN